MEMTKETKRNIIVGIIILIVFVLFAKMAFTSPKTKITDKVDDDKIELSGDMVNKYGKFDIDGDGRLDEYEMKEYSSYVMDSMVNDIEVENNNKRVKNSLENSGVDITKVTITHDEYSPKWDNVKINFKNNTGKTIKAIRFKWYDVKNAFGEEINPTYTGGNMTEIISNGRQTYGVWETYEDQIESVKVYISKIVFTDGTTWDNE